MILSLRQRHRRMFAVIGVMLPLAFVIGITARRPVPTVATLPMELSGPSRAITTTMWERSDLFAKTPMRTRLLRESGGADGFAVELSTAKDFVKPDLIVYWAAGNAKITDTLPDNAILLGAFSSAALPLPQEATKREGLLVLYSLADNEVVDVSKPIQFTATAR